MLIFIPQSFSLYLPNLSTLFVFFFCFSFLSLLFNPLYQTLASADNPKFWTPTFHIQLKLSVIISFHLGSISLTLLRKVQMRRQSLFFTIQFHQQNHAQLDQYSQQENNLNFYAVCSALCTSKARVTHNIFVYNIAIKRYCNKKIFFHPIFFSPVN